MPKEILTKEEKIAELKKYHDIVLATIDYCAEHYFPNTSVADSTLANNFQSLKFQAEEDFKKGKLTKLKQFFKNLAEIPLETNDLKFTSYLQNRTKYDIDIFKSYFQRIDKIIEKGKISSDSQFYEIHSMVNQLCQIQPADEEKIKLLNKLLVDYEFRKARHTKKTNA